MDLRDTKGCGNTLRHGLCMFQSVFKGCFAAQFCLHLCHRMPQIFSARRRWCFCLIIRASFDGFFHNFFFFLQMLWWQTRHPSSANKAAVNLKARETERVGMHFPLNQQGNVLVFTLSLLCGFTAAPSSALVTSLQNRASADLLQSYTQSHISSSIQRPLLEWN